MLVVNDLKMSTQKTRNGKHTKQTGKNILQSVVLVFISLYLYYVFPFIYKQKRPISFLNSICLPRS